MTPLPARPRGLVRLIDPASTHWHCQETGCSPVDRIREDAKVWRIRLAGVREVRRGGVVPPRPERVGDRPVLGGR